MIPVFLSRSLNKFLLSLLSWVYFASIVKASYGELIFLWKS
jgi:hypothetical protein